MMLCELFTSRISRNISYLFLFFVWYHQGLPSLTFIIFSVLLSTEAGGPVVGTGGAGVGGGPVADLGADAWSTEALLLSFEVPLGSW